LEAEVTGKYGVLLAFVIQHHLYIDHVHPPLIYQLDRAHLKENVTRGIESRFTDSAASYSMSGSRVLSKPLAGSFDEPKGGFGLHAVDPLSLVDQGAT
jgi:hypothetical protein